jgi:hypothetical protein
MVKYFILFSIIMLFSACVGPASHNDSPNFLQRAEILSKNNKSITIEHSSWGKKIAFRIAQEHAESLGMTAVYKGSSQQYGPDVISTWSLE